MKIDSKSIVVAAITLALTVALAPLPFVFMLPMLFTCTTRGMKMSLFMGLAFGVTSLMYSFILSASIVGIAFIQAPWIAIVPRIAVAFLARGAFVLSKRLINPRSNLGYTAPYVISGLVGSISNTVLVVGLFVLVMPGLEFEGVTMLLAVPAMLIFGVVEAFAYAVLVPATAISVEKAMGRYGRRDNTRLMPKDNNKEDTQDNNKDTQINPKQASKIRQNKES